MRVKSGFRFQVRKSFAAAFKKWRRQNNIPLKQIAADLGVSITTIDLWESGRRFPCSEHLDALAEYIGLLPCQFFCILADQCQPGECRLAAWPASSD